MAPPNSSSFSVSVVLPASGWEMIANVRRRATSLASGDAEGDSAVRAMSDMGRAFGREDALDQGDSSGCVTRLSAPYRLREDCLPSAQHTAGTTLPLS